MPHCPALAQPNRQGTIPLEPESISGRLRLSRTMGKAGTMAFSDGCPPFRHRGSVTSGAVAVLDLPPAPADAADAARCPQVAVSLHRSAQRKQISLSLSELFGVRGHLPDSSCSGCSGLAFGDPLSRGLCFLLLSLSDVTGSVEGLWVSQNERDLPKNSVKSVMPNVSIVRKTTLQSRVCFRDGDDFIIFICLM